MSSTISCNPYDYQSPVDSSEIFAGRKYETGRIIDEISRLKASRQINPIIALKGERRVGKTSLLNQIIKSEIAHDFMIINIRLERTLDAVNFWEDILTHIYLELNKLNIITKIVGSQETEPIGFLADSNNEKDHLVCTLCLPNCISVGRITSVALRSDFRQIVKAIKEVNKHGLLIIIDEAHYLLSAEDIVNQLRAIRDEVPGIGIVFAGKPELSNLFSDTDRPLYGQGTIIEINNFSNIDDIATCAISPLLDSERVFMSPMTIDYIAKLSRGKPNQIRLICHAIYERFRLGNQKDLNITKEALFDVINMIKIQERDSQQISTIDYISKMNSVDLEILHNMTRFPNWTVEDVVNLDESFRGEADSKKSFKRRLKFIQNRKEEFINYGILENNEDKCVLRGGEFINLYLRFYIEIRRYGKISNNINLNVVVPTPFTEKCLKLVSSICYTLGDNPEIGYTIFHTYFEDQQGDVLLRIKDRYDFLKDILSKKPVTGDKRFKILFAECASICELVKKSNNYWLFCISIRNRDNPTELIQIELYFNRSEPIYLDPVVIDRINKQAEIAHVAVINTACFSVDLPDLESLFIALGTNLEKTVSNTDMTNKWKILSLQQAVKTFDKNDVVISDCEKDMLNNPSWVTSYRSGQIEEAIKEIDECLGKTTNNFVQARLFNDRGYIRYCLKDRNQKEEANKDLQVAIDFHYVDLRLTLLNQAFILLDQNKLLEVIDKCEFALILSTNHSSIDASYLRYRLPAGPFGSKERLEMTPANTIEAAYINMAFAFLMSDSIQDAFDCLEEGLEVIPSSFRLKHALARFYYASKKAPEALKIYRELKNLTLPDPSLESEFNIVLAKKKK